MFEKLSDQTFRHVIRVDQIQSRRFSCFPQPSVRLVFLFRCKYALMIFFHIQRHLKKMHFPTISVERKKFRLENRRVSSIPVNEQFAHTPRMMSRNIRKVKGDSSNKCKKYASAAHLCDNNQFVINCLVKVFLHWCETKNFTCGAGCMENVWSEEPF